MTEYREPDIEARIPCDVWVIKHPDDAPEGTIVTPTIHYDVWLAWRIVGKEVRDGEERASAQRELRADEEGGIDFTFVQRPGGEAKVH